MAAPRRDTGGIVDPAGLLARVHFRRREPAAPLRRYLEHYWLIDWDLTEPYVSQVVPHPCVNVVFQRRGDAAYGEVAGVGLGLFEKKLTGRGSVCGIQFRPGGFRPFAPGAPVSRWTGRRLPLAEVFPGCGPVPEAVTSPATDAERAAALDAFLLARDPAPDPQTSLAMDLTRRIRHDRTIRRVTDLARTQHLSVRTLQRLFHSHVGVGPKWVILRYRIHEALERAAADRVDWSGLAADLGYADQAHLVRDFTSTVGAPPTAYGQTLTRAAS